MNNKKAETIKTRLFLITGSILLTLIILELILRLGGGLFLFLQNFNNSRKSGLHTSDLRILCVGESTTALGGQDSYPTQLEKYLNQNSLNQSYMVINKGIPATNTSIIADRIEGWIREYQPDIIIAMMGINDNNPLIPHQEITGNGRISSFVQNLRVIKLGNHIKAGIKSKSQVHTQNQKRDNEIHLGHVPVEKAKMFLAAMKLKANRAYPQAEIILRAIGASNENPTFTNRVYRELAECLLKQNKHLKLAKVLNYFFEKDAYDFFANETMKKLCLAQSGTSELTSMLTHLTEAHPQSERYFNLLGACYGYMDDQQKAESTYKKAQQLREKHFNPVTQNNFYRIINLARSFETPLVLMQYPMRNIDQLKNFVKNPTHFDHILFVDNEDIFRQALREGSFEEYFTDRFAGDFGHCSQKGNALIAENLARNILKILQ